MQSNVSPDDRIDRLIRHWSAFGIALLTAVLLLVHPQLVADRLGIAGLSVGFFAWLALNFRTLSQTSLTGHWLPAALPYVSVCTAALVYWRFGATVPQLILLLPITGLAPAFGRSRTQGWSLALVIALITLVTPWLPGRQQTPAHWLAVAYAACITFILLACIIELHHHHTSRFAKQAQSLRRAETMATVGLMATAAAHEIRNPLTTIKGFVQYLRQHNLVDSNAVPYLDLIERDADRIGKIVDNFVRLGQPLSVQPASLHAGDIVQEIVREVAEQAMLTGIEIHVKRAAAPPVWADPTLLRKAVRHVVKNGLEAMAGHSGRLTVTVKPAGRGDYVEVRVQDNGNGMDRHQIDRAFEAFYSTKIGAGLGLPIVRRIMDAHGGDIQLNSPRRGGTTVTLVWPTQATFAPNPTPSEG